MQSLISKKEEIDGLKNDSLSRNFWIAAKSNNHGLSKMLASSKKNYRAYILKKVQHVIHTCHLQGQGNKYFDSLKTNNELIASLTGR